MASAAGQARSKAGTDIGTALVFPGHGHSGLLVQVPGSEKQFLHGRLFASDAGTGRKQRNRAVARRYPGTSLALLDLVLRYEVIQMAINENRPGLLDLPVIPEVGTGTSLHPLHEAAMRLADMGLTRVRSRSKTRDLVSMLLSHGARAWRLNQPPASVHLYVAPNEGRFPIYLRIR